MNVNDILRRSALVDTSGAEPASALQMVPRMGGGVYVTDENEANDTIVGRLSLGILGAFILGAVAFYVWTNGIQGGG